MGRSFYTVSEPQVAIASPHADATANPEIASPAYRKWSPDNAFDPDSDEFFHDAVYEAFLAPISPISPASSRSSSTPRSESMSERASPRPLSPPADTGSYPSQREHDGYLVPVPNESSSRRPSSRIVPARRRSLYTYRPLVSERDEHGYFGIEPIDISMDALSDSDDDEHENEPAEPPARPIPRVHTSSITPIPAGLRPRGGPARPLDHSAPHTQMSPPVYAPASPPIRTRPLSEAPPPSTPPQALRELFATSPSHASFEASTPVSAVGISIPTPSTPTNMNASGAMLTPSPPPSVTPRLYSWTTADNMPAMMRVPESPSAGRERSSGGSPNGRGLRTVHGVRNARWPVY